MKGGIENFVSPLFALQLPADRSTTVKALALSFE